MKRALIDASSAIILYKVGLFQTTATAFHILMTRSVYKELTISGHEGADAFKEYYTNQRSFKVIPVEGIDSVDTKHLDRGERDTIQLFSSGVSDFIIVDDGKAARYCRDQNIPYINALLCPKVLCFSDKILENKLAELTNLILKTGRYSQEIISQALQCEKTDLSYFITP